MKEQFVLICLAYFRGHEIQMLKHIGVTNWDQDVDSLPFKKKTKKKDALEIVIVECVRNIYSYRKTIKDFSSARSSTEAYLESSRKRKHYLGEIQKLITTFIAESSENIYWNELAVESLYTRDPFAKSAVTHVDDLLVISCLYLLRAYCTFWIERTPQGRSLHWDHWAVNDHIQAYYLCWRIYNTLNLANTGEIDINEAIFKFKDIGPIDRIDTNTRGYVLWWMLLLIDIFNGNVYRKIHNDDAAFDFYCKVIRQFDGKCDLTQKIQEAYCNKDANCDGVKCKHNRFGKLKKDLRLVQQYYCKTLVKTRIEKAKIFFDRGYFLESLKWYVNALRDILVLDLCPDGGNGKYDKQISLFCKLSQIITVLNRKKERQLVDRSYLYTLFRKLLIDATSNFQVIKEVISEKHYYLIADILARVGFVLHTLREHPSNYASLSTEGDKYSIYFKSAQILGTDNIFASYCRLFISKEKGSSDDTYLDYFRDFSDKPERMFSAIAINLISSMKNKKELPIPSSEKSNHEQDLKKLALDLGLMTLENIDNIITTPKILNAYMMRRGYLKTISDPINKFVVLRRWQSFNPIIPRPHGSPTTKSNVPGGGYLLIWQGKGIAIDPGFGFIQNLYDEGFSIEDIDAVIITHAHIDHDSELSSILTLIFEWNNYWEKQYRKARAPKKKIDLFLNEGSYRKYQSWLYSPSGVVKKIYLLQLNVWDIEDNAKSENQITKRRGKNIEIDLAGENGYNLILEIVPAIHDEIIAKKSAIGLKIKLIEPSSRKPCFILGITGDTGSYEKVTKDKKENDLGMMYEDCNLLVAHLGDIKFREIRSLSEIMFSARELAAICNQLLPEDERVKALQEFVALIDLLKQDEVEDLGQFKTHDGIVRNASFGEAIDKLQHYIDNDRDWRYKNHLGIRGIFNLHKALCKHATVDESQARLLIIGEVPEELANCRHMLARYLNNKKYKCTRSSDDISLEAVKCLTGDVGLHVQIGKSTDYSQITVRCERCNQNNEMIVKGMHYHPVKNIVEIPVKKMGNRIVYLCNQERCRHSIYPDDMPKYFLSSLYPKSL